MKPLQDELAQRRIRAKLDRQLAELEETGGEAHVVADHGDSLLVCYVPPATDAALEGEDTGESWGRVTSPILMRVAAEAY